MSLGNCELFYGQEGVKFYKLGGTWSDLWGRNTFHSNSSLHWRENRLQVEIEVGEPPNLPVSLD